MGQKKHPFDLYLSQVAAAGSNDLAMREVEAGRLYAIQHVSVENETTAYTSLRILKAGRGGELLIVEELAPQAGVLYWHDDPIYLTEGQYLVCRLAGCTANDVIKAYLSGWYSLAYEIEEL